MTQPGLGFTFDVHTTEEVEIARIRPWPAHTGVRNWTGKSQSALRAFVPITLRRLTADADYDFEVRDGARRLNNAVKRGDTTVRATIVDTDELGGATLTLVANLARGENKVAELDALATLLDRGEDLAAFARTYGLSLPKLQQRAKLLELPPDFLDAVRSGQIAVSTALKLKPLTAQYDEARARLQAKGKLTASDVDVLSRTHKAAVTAALGDGLFALDAPDPRADLRAALRRAQAEGVSVNDIAHEVEVLRHERCS